MVCNCLHPDCLSWARMEIFPAINRLFQPLVDLKVEHFKCIIRLVQTSAAKVICRRMHELVSPCTRARLLSGFRCHGRLRASSWKGLSGVQDPPEPAMLSMLRDRALASRAGMVQAICNFIWIYRWLPQVKCSATKCVFITREPRLPTDNEFKDLKSTSSQHLHGAMLKNTGALDPFWIM